MAQRRKQIKFLLKKGEKEYLKQTKEAMLDLQYENSGIFGDPDKLRYYKAFNSLEDWEKNLLLLYTKYESYAKVAERLNVQKNTTTLVIKEIITKLNYIINGKDINFNQSDNCTDLGYIPSTTVNG